MLFCVITIIKLFRYLCDTNVESSGHLIQAVIVDHATISYVIEVSCDATWLSTYKYTDRHTYTHIHIHTYVTKFVKTHHVHTQ